MSGLLASAIVIPSSTESMAWSFSLSSSRAARGTRAVGWSSSSWGAAEEDAEEVEGTAPATGGEGESGGCAAAAAAAALVIIMEERRIPWSSASRAATRVRSREASSSARGCLRK